MDKTDRSIAEIIARNHLIEGRSIGKRHAAVDPIFHATIPQTALPINCPACGSLYNDFDLGCYDDPPPIVRFPCNLELQDVGSPEAISGEHCEGPNADWWGDNNDKYEEAKERISDFIRPLERKRDIFWGARKRLLGDLIDHSSVVGGGSWKYPDGRLNAYAREARKRLRDQDGEQ